MNSLMKALDAVKEGATYDNKKKFEDAKDKYTSALAHFRCVLVSDDEKVLGLKTQVGEEIEFYINRMNKLDMILSNKNSKQNLETEQNLSNNADDKAEIKFYLNRIKKLETLLQEIEQNLELVQLSSNDDDMDVKIRTRIKSTMLTENTNVKFTDVCGLESLKEDLIQAALLPLKQPQLFSTNTKPYKGFLLFGPPGTGKTFIAKALAGEIHGTNFFSISIGNVLSKYIGESESYIRNLFELARDTKPSIIFFDEIDVLAMERSDTGHDSCRGVLTELLVQMDGLKGSNDGILIVAATNMPHHLDNGILRRFDKLIYVPLPTAEDRRKMFKQKFSTVGVHFSDENFDELAAKTSGFSGSDIDNICNKANNMALARLKKCNYFNVLQDDGKFSYIPCDSYLDPQQNKIIKLDIMEIPVGSLSAKPIPVFKDLIETISQARPSVPKSDIYIYEKFVEERVGFLCPQASDTNTRASLSCFDILGLFNNCFL